MIFVVGSGPAGVSAAAALLRNGHEVTMLDAGLVLEQSRQHIVHQLAATGPADWDDKAVATLKENLLASSAGIPLKYSYGSDFPYRDADHYLPSQSTHVGILPSLAKGGLSNVWGAAVLPYSANDLADWPITLDELVPHYESVCKLIRLSAARDDLATRFPLYSDDISPLPPSRQASELFADLAQHREALRAQGIWFGSARLAMQGDAPGQSCTSCGMCMYGCPYGLIYNAANTVDHLAQQDRFTYRDGLIVESFTETAGGVRISARRMLDRAPVILEGSALFVAAGTLATTRMFLQSVEAYDHTLNLKDSQYFLLPLLRYRRVPGVFGEPLHTMAQLFLEIFDDQISNHNVHLQVYTYNELYQQAIRASLGIFDRPLRSLSRAFLERFLLIQGYLHSDLSPTIDITLRAARGDRPSELVIHGRPNADASRALKKVIRKLRGCRSLLKAFPLAPLAKMGEPGRGFHAGGTLPMRRKPKPFETDRFGRPTGFRRVHLVDASVFPSIGAGTITLTVMANAHRIASAYGTTAASSEQP